MRRILSSIGFTVALLCPWIAFAQNAADSCTTTSQNLWVRDQLNTYYYWYQFMPPGVNPASFNSPEAYLEAVRYRPIDNTFSFITLAAANDAFYSDSQFIGYGFGNQTTTTEHSRAAGLRRQPRVGSRLVARRSHHHGERPDRAVDGRQRHDRQRLRRRGDRRRHDDRMGHARAASAARRAWSSGSSPFPPCR